MGCCLKPMGKQGKINNEMQKDFEAGTHQGVHQLKQNYKISAQTQVLGAGSFGKVFLSTWSWNTVRVASFLIRLPLRKINCLVKVRPQKL